MRGRQRPAADESRRTGGAPPPDAPVVTPDQSVTPPEPAIPEDISFSDLDREVRAELRSLPKARAEAVAGHLVAAGRLLEEDPAQAFAHALAARRLAARLAAVREAVGLAAYHAGEWHTAAAELRTYHRISGRWTHLAVVADCERALGRPERAIDLFRTADRAHLTTEETMELLIVASGARRDLGQHEVAVAMLQVPELSAADTAGPWVARLRYAYADALLDADRPDQAREWFARAAVADEDSQTDAAERLLALDGVVLEESGEPAEEDPASEGDGEPPDEEDPPGGSEPASLDEAVSGPEPEDGPGSPEAAAETSAAAEPAAEETAAEEPAAEEPVGGPGDELGDQPPDPAGLDGPEGPSGLEVPDPPVEREQPEAPDHLTPGAEAPAPPGRLVDAYDLVILDLDGVVYLGDEPIPSAAAAAERLRAERLPVVFATNNASRSPDQVARLLRRLGIEATAGEVLTSAAVAADALAERLAPGTEVLVVGTESLADEVRRVGLRPVRSADEEPGAVIQGYGPEVGWAALAEAYLAIRAGAPWVVTNTDATLPSPRGLLPGNGALVAALRTALEREPDLVVGKPQAAFFQAAARRTGATAPLVVGDRLDTDIEGANRAGMDSLLVLTGVARAADARTTAWEHRPTYVGDDLTALFAPPPAAGPRAAARLTGAFAA